jgi:hypothetical protein
VSKKTKDTETAGTDLVIPTVMCNQISLEVALNSADCLAIFTSGADKFIRKGIAKYAAEAAFHNKQAADVADRLHALVTETVKKQAAGPAAQVASALAAFGHKVTFSVAVPPNPSPHTTKLNTSVTFLQTGLAGNSICTVPFEVKVSPGMTKLAKQNIAENMLVNEAKERQLTWTRRLSSVPAMERQMRGELAAMQACKTEDGRRMLKMLSENIEERVESMMAE